MTVIEAIVLIASIITSLTVIITAIVTCYKFIRKWDKWVEKKDEHDKENYLSLLRLTIVSHEMPLSERIEAGDKYIERGGNGAVKQKYKELLTIYQEQNKE
ncbi:MAG: hypothetical protein ACI4IK_02870 [Eubacterium sp.]